MFSSGTTAIGNTIRNSVGSFGVGIGMKDSSDFTILNNDIVYNARGYILTNRLFNPERLIFIKTIKSCITQAVFNSKFQEKKKHI